MKLKELKEEMDKLVAQKKHTKAQLFRIKEILKLIQEKTKK